MSAATCVELEVVEQRAIEPAQAAQAVEACVQAQPALERTMPEVWA